MSTPTAPPVSEPSDTRSLSYAAFAVIVVIYLGIIQLGGIAVQHIGDHENSFATTEGVLWNLWIPIGGALIYTYAVIAVLGWWRLFDFSILTGTVILVDQDPYVGSAFAILAYVVVAVVLLVRRHSIEFPQKDPTFRS